MNTGDNKFRASDRYVNQDQGDFLKALHAVEGRYAKDNKAKDFLAENDNAEIDDIVADVHPRVFEALEGGNGNLTRTLQDLDKDTKKKSLGSSLTSRLFGRAKKLFYDEQPPNVTNKDFKGSREESIAVSANREVAMPALLNASNVWSHDIAKDEKNKKMLGEHLGKELIAEPESDPVLTYAMGFLEEKVDKDKSTKFLEKALGIHHPDKGNVDGVKEDIDLLKTSYDEMIDAHQKIRAKIGNKEPAAYLKELQHHLDEVGNEKDISDFKKTESDLKRKKDDLRDAETELKKPETQADPTNKTLAEGKVRDARTAVATTERLYEAAKQKMLNRPYGSAEFDLMMARSRMAEAQGKDNKESAKIDVDEKKATLDLEKKRYEGAKHHLEEFEALRDKLAVASRDYQRQVAKIKIPDEAKDKDTHAALTNVVANAKEMSEAIGGGSYNENGGFIKTTSADPKNLDKVYEMVSNRTTVKDFASLKKHNDARLKAEEEKAKKAGEHHEVHKITSSEFLYKIYHAYITLPKAEGGTVDDDKKLNDIEKRKRREEAIMFAKFAASDAKDMSVFAANKARCEALAKKGVKFLPDFNKILETLRFISSNEKRPFAQLQLKHDTSRVELRHMIKTKQLSVDDIPLLIAHLQKTLEGHENKIIKPKDIPFVMAMIRNLRLLREESRYQSIMKKPGKFDEKLKEYMAEDNAIDTARDAIDDTLLFTMITDPKIASKEKAKIAKEVREKVRSGQISVTEAMKELKEGAMDPGRGTFARLVAIRSGANIKRHWQNIKGKGPIAWGINSAKGAWKSIKAFPSWFKGTRLGKAVDYSTTKDNYFLNPLKHFSGGGHGGDHGGGGAHGGGGGEHH